MRVLCWSGPLHDQVVDVEADEHGQPPAVLQLDVDGRRVLYRAMKLDTGPGEPLARDRREPRWWSVYVPDDAIAHGQRQLDVSRRPMVTGPVRPHPLVVARGKRLAAPEHDELLSVRA